MQPLPREEAWWQSHYRQKNQFLNSLQLHLLTKTHFSNSEWRFKTDSKLIWQPLPAHIWVHLTSEIAYWEGQHWAPDMATITWNELDSKYLNHTVKIPFFHSVEPILFDLSEHSVLVRTAEVHNNSQNLLPRIRENEYFKNFKIMDTISEIEHSTHKLLYLYPKHIHCFF